jgi:DNA-binding CsgD family transcriptional regulator
MLDHGGSMRSTPLGRTFELTALSNLLDDVAEARATVTVVCGAAGQGKTVLVDWTVDAARARGFDVLRAAGVEFERGLAFGGLTAVLRPLLGRVDELTELQAQALRGALRLERADAPALAVYGATLAVLSDAAVDTPLLVAVDDAHWIDRASLEALVFAAHRCDADRVGFVFAQRTTEPCLLDQTRFPRLELSDLDRQSAVQVAAAEGVAPQVAERCWALTHGNPLALIEGVQRLSEAQRTGAAPLPAVLPVDDRLLDEFRIRLAGLGAGPLRALGVAALASDDDLGVIAAALADLGGSTDDLVAAEQHQVVTLNQGRVWWRHPLLRCATYESLDPEERRRLHGALSRATAGAGRDDQAVWHLSESVTGPDDEVAAMLAGAAAAAYRRGALAAAAEAYEQAARLTTSAEQRPRYLLGAADVLWATGDFLQVAGLLRPVIDRTEDPLIRGDMAVILGQAETWLAGAHEATHRFEEHARATAGVAPDRTAVLMLHAMVTRLMALDIDGAVTASAAAAEAAERTGDAAVLFGAYAARALATFFAGGGSAAEVAIEPIGQLASASLDDKDDQGVAAIIQLCAFAHLVRGDGATAIDLLSQVIDHSDRSGMLARAVLARTIRAEALWRQGRWAESLAQMSHLMTMQQATSQLQFRAVASAVLTRVEAGLGHEEACRRHGTETLDMSVPVASDQLSAWALSGLGLLELGAGRHAAAAAHFDEVTALAGHVPEPGVLWWHGDAVEAYHRSGRATDAEDALDRLQQLAAQTGRPWAVAAAHRSAAIVGQCDDPDDELAAALAGFAAAGAPFEEARTLLARGELRIEDGDRRAGALDVARARTIFDRLGARAWSDRASRLRGEASRVRASLDARLTPAELRVAMAVGHGLSNRAAADRLFISVKTVDYHLQGIYRKLGLRGRSQLAAIVAAEETHPTAW